MTAALAATIPAEKTSTSHVRTAPRGSDTVRTIRTRFPAAWLACYTGDTVRVATLANDYGRPARGEINRRGCFASDETLATQLGLHPVTVQSAFAVLEDRKNVGAAAVVSSTRSHRSTMTRWVKPIGKHEKCVEVSSHARTVLAANRFKVYAFISLENDFETEPSAKEITAGLKLAAETVRQALNGLQADGWIPPATASPSPPTTTSSLATT